ncbi:MAG: zf-HC2 domain-containing protein [Gammaproteobacteria bacterium]
MTPRDVTPAGSHDEVQLLLPGYVTRRLTDEQNAFVQAHLRHCGTCRADLHWDARLAGAEPPVPEQLDAERALHKMMGRLPPAPPAVQPPVPLRARLRDALGWAPWALALPAMLAVLVLLRPSGRPAGEAADYRALANAPAVPTHPTVVVVFGPDTRMRAVDDILRANGARIIDGPSETGAYLLQVAPARQDAVIAALKSQAHAQLAESLAPARP